MAARAVIFGCRGQKLTAEERTFFKEAEPWGFILFDAQLRQSRPSPRAGDGLRDCVGREDAPVLIDQEGGRVQRLKPPHWRAAPPAARFGSSMSAIRRAPARRSSSIRSSSRPSLPPLGITVDCLPVLDVPVRGAHDVIGDRAFSRRAEVVAKLGRIACEALLEAGVLPVIKHMPGHGRAAADSHLELPRVDGRPRNARSFRLRALPGSCRHASRHDRPCASIARLMPIVPRRSRLSSSARLSVAISALTAC